MFTKPANWNKLTPEQKRDLRMDAWESAEGIQFDSPAAEANWREKAHRYRNAVTLQGTDRLIANCQAGEYALRRKGITGKQMVYTDGVDFVTPILEFNKEFEPDLAISAFAYPGKALDLLDLKTYIWSGQKLPENQVIQYAEGEYMRPDEYKAFSQDPTGFFMKTYLPRMFGTLAPMQMFPDFIRVTEIVDTAGFAIPFGLPPVQDMLKKLMAAGEAALQWGGLMGSMGGALSSAGYVSMGSGFCKAPFDFLGDTLRGTKGILMDLYRRPNDVLAACEAYAPLLIQQMVASCDMMGAPMAMYPLHKGADGFMSQPQFEKFYWPTLKAVMLGLWEEGIVNYMFVEGSYNSRLETIAELPKGSVCWWFDQTDMRMAKDCLNDHHLVAGNVPPSLMSTGHR